METLFSLSGMLVMPAWLALMVLPFWWPVTSRIIQFSVPVVLSFGYTVLIVLYWGDSPGGFDSLAAVRTLFSSDGALMAGWMHYLAFDLFIGAWIVERARQQGIHHGWTLPCLPLTFLFGPIGLLLYLIIERISRLGATLQQVTA